MNNTQTQPLSKNLNLDGLRTAPELKKAGYTAFKVTGTQGKSEFVRRFTAKRKGAKKPVSFAYQYAKGAYEEEQVYTDTLKVVAAKAAAATQAPVKPRAKKKVSAK